VVLVFLFLALRFLFWAIKNGQYDDLNTEGRRVLFDDEPDIETENKPGPQNDIEKRPKS
jgi:cbb3-type cytochrome oxidase maturation protein